ncbi:hypothetical protein AB0N07_37930 [Streptomyces sp. NPDC051172]|uniref:hypothetical protein n=1 Tax=Streptomyces sp. NPDC051172 TaxID=3155796 RepID=UPI00341D1611
MRTRHTLDGVLSEGMGLRAIARHLGRGRHTVQRYARAARRAGHGRRTPLTHQPSRHPSGWINRHPDTLTEDEVQHLKAVLNACPELEQTHDLVRDFARMLSRHTGAGQPNWISNARDARLPGITGLARGLTATLACWKGELSSPVIWEGGVREDRLREAA